MLQYLVSQYLVSQYLKLQKKSHVNLTWDFFINLGGDRRLDPIGFFFWRLQPSTKKKILRGPGACRLLGFNHSFAKFLHDRLKDIAFFQEYFACNSKKHKRLKDPTDQIVKTKGLKYDKSY